MPEQLDKLIKRLSGLASALQSRLLDVPSKRGPYEFVSMQPGSDAPVTYDPCRPIHYVVNHTGQPNDAENLVTDAIERISEVTGLQFVADDLTDEEIVPDRQPYQPDRYGDRWAPVLIAWGIAFFEYCLAVPANRLGFAHGWTAGQLKIAQEAIALIVFGVFMVTMLGEPLGWRHVAAFACIMAAVGFMFIGR